MADPKKTLYHSELVKISPVVAIIKSDVMQSKYEGKPDYCVLEIDGHERNYNCENPSCAAALDGLKNSTVTIYAEGGRDDATIKINDQPPQSAQPRQPATAHRNPAAPAAQKPATTLDQNRARTPMGPTVGMAINNACTSLTAQGQPLDPKRVFEIASDLLRISYYLEDGNLAPTFEHRSKAVAKPASEPKGDGPGF